jgi:D-galactose 1-dehydrogenase
VHLTSDTPEFPENRQTPIAARLTFTQNITADFDWRQTGPQTWDIEVETTDGPMALRMSGNRFKVGGVEIADENSIMGEYPALYSRMAELVAAGQSDVDVVPLVHVADALTLGARQITDPFTF